MGQTPVITHLLKSTPASSGQVLNPNYLSEIVFKSRYIAKKFAKNRVSEIRMIFEALQYQEGEKATHLASVLIKRSNRLLSDRVQFGYQD